MTSKKSYQRNTILQTAIILSVIYVGVPLVLHLFPDDHGQGEVITNSKKEPQVGNEGSHQQAPLSFTNILAVLTLIFLAIRHSAELLVVRLPLLLYLPIKQLYLLFAYIARTIGRLLYPVLVPLIYGTQFATAFLLIPITIFRMGVALFYPVYVFVGAACTCGAVLGLAARFTNSFILSNIFSVDTRRPKHEPSPSSREVKSSSMRGRGRQKKMR